MKTFIFLFILIVAFFTYIFTSADNSNAIRGKRAPVIQQQPPTLELIERSAQTDFSKDVDPSDTTSSSSSAEPEDMYNSNTPSIPECMTFDKFEALLLEINPYYPKSAVTLNLPLSSVIRTKREKQAFREKMQHDFHLSETEIERMMREDKLIWDWINLLR